MFKIPKDKEAVFVAVLEKKGVPLKNNGIFLKWVRFFIDFCQKYNFNEHSRESITPFIKKLEQKRQTLEQQKQASRSILLYLGVTHNISNNENKGADVKRLNTSQSQSNLKKIIRKPPAITVCKKIVTGQAHKSQNRPSTHPGW